MSSHKSNFFFDVWQNLFKIWHLAEWDDMLSCCSVPKFALAPCKDQSQDLEKKKKKRTWWKVVATFVLQISGLKCLRPLWTVSSVWLWASASSPFIYSGYQDIVCTWPAAFFCVLNESLIVWLLTQFCSLQAAMWILASYTDKDKENVYETPGFNKTKNLSLLLVFLFLPHTSFSKTAKHKISVFVAFILHIFLFWFSCDDGMVLLFSIWVIQYVMIHPLLFTASKS